MRILNYTVTIEAPDGKNRSFKIPQIVAWVASQAIAIKTHQTVVLKGSKGTARFNPDGSGIVEWAGETKEFAASTMCAI